METTLLWITEDAATTLVRLGADVRGFLPTGQPDHGVYVEVDAQVKAQLEARLVGPRDTPSLVIARMVNEA